MRPQTHVRIALFNNASSLSNANDDFKSLHCSILSDNKGSY